MRKLSRYLVLVFTIVTVNFAIPRLMPGDPLVLLFGEEFYGVALRTPEIIQSLTAKYGLDKPIVEQFFIYLGNLINGDMGYSFSYGRPVLEIIVERLPMTLLMTLPPVAASLAAGSILGLHLGFRAEKRLKQAASSILVLVRSIPPYWTSMVLILVFSLWLNLTPTGGAPPAGAPAAVVISHLALPFLVVFLYDTAYVALIVRGLTIEVVEEAFVTTARSKGLRGTTFKARHLLLPSLAPFLSLAAIEIGFAFSGALLVEIAFSWPGIGYTMWQAVVERDYPLLQAAFTTTALVVVAANALADLASYLLDPRIREEAWPR
ncbi:MAG: ABC transporter permease [Candidatus Nezhaarchaeota archaeon]|nr:ABC transporter permease [Candidatus Nezhaarchaeota archaeon]